MKSIICENYKIFIGENILRNIQLDSYKKICLLTDKNQKNNILDYFLKEIKSEFDIIEIESSEINKNISSLISSRKANINYLMRMQAKIINLLL